MKEVYEKLEIDIECIFENDVITTSSVFDDNEDEHDNGYIDGTTDLM